MDGRTTVMVRNIPNKYTQEMLLKRFEQNHKKKFDFFYLPVDYTVIILLYRIIVTLGMHLLILYMQNLLENSIENFINLNGKNLIV